MNNNDLPDRGRRYRVQLEADIVQPDGSRVATIVSDLSLEGCSVVGWFRIGDKVVLSIPRVGKVQGKVRWAMRGKAGLRLEPAAGQAER